MPPTIFRGVAHAYPDVCDQLLVLLASQIRMLAPRQRVCHAQRPHLHLCGAAAPCPDGAQSGKAIMSPPPTHAELAARVSSHPEALTRELNSLKRAGLLGRRRGALVLLDPAHLASIVTKAAR
jgi:hypothetical protein